MEAAGRAGEAALSESESDPESAAAPEPEPGGFGPGPAPAPGPGRSSARDALGRYPASRVSRTNFGLLNGQTDWQDCPLTEFRIELRSGLLFPCKRKRCTTEPSGNTFRP